jgi:hypothetical protein
MLFGPISLKVNVVAPAPFGVKQHLSRPIDGHCRLCSAAGIRMLRLHQGQLSRLNHLWWRMLGDA